MGNLAANLEHGDSILKEGALDIFMALIRSEEHPVQRMAAMALCNLSSNVSNNNADYHDTCRTQKKDGLGKFGNPTRTYGTKSFEGNKLCSPPLDAFN